MAEYVRVFYRYCSPKVEQRLVPRTDTIPSNITERLRARVLRHRYDGDGTNRVSEVVRFQHSVVRVTIQKFMNDNILQRTNMSC